MNKQTIQTYKTKQEEILAMLDQSLVDLKKEIRNYQTMHSTPEWTAEMVKLEDKLNVRRNFLQNRIIEIEKMICS